MVRYKLDDGTESLSPFGMWGLTVSGVVVLLDADVNGIVEVAADSANFVGLTFPGELTNLEIQSGHRIDKARLAALVETWSSPLP